MSAGSENIPQAVGDDKKIVTAGFFRGGEEISIADIRRETTLNC